MNIRIKYLERECILKFSFFIFLGYSCVSSGQLIKSKPYNPKDYTVKHFKTETKTIQFDQLTVELIQVHIEDSSHRDYPFFSCWIHVSKEESLVSSISFYDIWGLGGTAGLFFPVKQHVTDALIICKQGDYDGRTVVVKKDGTVGYFPGGEAWVTENQKFLLSIHVADGGYGIYCVELSSLELIQKDLYETVEFVSLRQEPGSRKIHILGYLYALREPAAITLVFDPETGKSSKILGDFSEFEQKYPELEPLKQVDVFETK